MSAINLDTNDVYEFETVIIQEFHNHCTAEFISYHKIGEPLVCKRRNENQRVFAYSGRCGNDDRFCRE